MVKRFVFCLCVVSCLLSCCIVLSFSFMRWPFFVVWFLVICLAWFGLLYV